MFLVGLPYLRAKAHDYFEALGGGVNHDILDESANSRQQRVLAEQVSVSLRHALALLIEGLDSSRARASAVQETISVCKHGVRAMVAGVECRVSL